MQIRRRAYSPTHKTKDGRNAGAELLHNKEDGMQKSSI